MRPASLVRPFVALPLLASLLVPMAGCQVVAGSGNVVEETREIGAFTRIDIGSGVEVNVTVGQNAPFVIAGDDNIIALFTSDIRDGTLVVEIDPAVSHSPTRPVTVTVGTEALEAISASGGSKLLANEVTGADVVLDASGASTVDVEDVIATRSLRIDSSGGSTWDLAGSAPTLALDASGASVVDAAELVVDAATVELSGGSTGELTVNGQLDADLSGGSQLTVRGETELGAIDESGGSQVIVE